jgi:hypothetical protein
MDTTSEMDVPRFWPIRLASDLKQIERIRLLQSA